MTLDEISKFMLRYKLDSAINFDQLPLTTSGNVSYTVLTPHGSYVIRTLVRQSPSGAEDECVIQAQLNAAGIATPQYLKNKVGSVVSTLNGKPAVISKEIVGSRQPDDTLSLANNMGKVLAQIHTVLHDITIRQNEQQWFDPINTTIQLARYTGPDKSYIMQKTNEYASIFAKNLPMAITHGDFHTNNIFSAGNSVTAVFDFESAQYTVRLLDIARLYLTYRKVTNLDPTDILSAVFKGYDATIPYGLTDQEYKELNSAFIYTALVTSASIFNHGNSFSSDKYLQIAKALIKEPIQFIPDAR